MAKGAWQPWGQMKRWKHRALILRGSTQGAFVCYNVEGLKHQTKASREHAHQDIMTTATIVAEGRSTAPHGPLGVLMLGALGVVYGDIGTSPLYTLKTALDWAGGATPATAIGMLSLIAWTLVITTSIKYVAVVMRADNEGEGGILALMSLLGIKHGERAAVIALGVLGAALLYGDGAITPAISVLSALEGLKTPMPAIAPYIVALSALILVGLFALQSQGTDRIGKLFGPIMTVWFVTIGVLGLVGIISHPGVLVALDPRYGFAYLFGHGTTGFLVLGAVFLCATGAEALYADMGHFGARRSASPGMGWCCRACCSTMPARRQSWSTAAPAPIRSSRCARTLGRCRWLGSQPSPRLSPANRSSAAPFP
jgi:K+ transporter